MALIKVRAENVMDNPYRDMNLNPIRETTVEEIMASMKETGVWKTLTGRPSEAMKLEEIDALGDSLGKTDISDIRVELSFGHHRVAAMRELEHEYVEIDIIPLSDEKMLKMMALENQSDRSGNMAVYLETVHQVIDKLLGEVRGSDNFTDYQEKGNTFFAKKEAYKNAKTKDTVGFKMVHKFLGADTWSVNDIQRCCSTLKDVEDGIYEQEQVIAMPSIGVLGGFAGVARKIRDTDWPLFFKDTLIKEVSDIACASETTVKVLKNTASHVKDGKNPIKYIKKGSVTDFSVMHAIKDLVYKTGMDVDAILLEDLPTMEGFKDYPELDKLIEEVKVSIKRSEDASNAAGGAGEVAAEEGEVATEQGDLENTVSAALTDAEGQPIEEIDSLPDMEEGVVTPIGALTEIFVRSSGTYIKQIEALVGRAAEISPDDAQYFEALDLVTQAIVTLFADNFAVEDLTQTVDKIIANLE